MKRALGIAVVLLVVCPPGASAVQRVATVRGHLTVAPQLVGSKVAWQVQRCVKGCADLPIDCESSGTTYDYAFRVAAPLRTLFTRRLNCSASGPENFQESVSAAASATRLAVGVNSSSNHEAGPSQVSSRLTAGSTQLYSCTTESATHGSFQFALGGDAIAYDSDACGESRSYVVRDLATGQVHPVPQPALSSVYSPRLAGRYFAFLRSPFTLVVHDWQADAQAYSVVLPPARYPQSLDVDSEGEAAVLTRNPDESTNTCSSERVSWLSPAEPRLHELPALPCSSAVRIGSGSVLYEAGTPTRRSLQAVALKGGSPRAVARFGAVHDYGFDSDGRLAAYALRTCGGSTAIYLQSLAEKTFSAGSSRCPLAIRSPLPLSGRMAKLTLNCPRACTGEVRLRRGKRLLARRAFGSEHRGRKILKLRLARGLHNGRARIAVTLTHRDLRERTVRKTVRLG